ncbi:MAG: M42 family metallopeptidase, partial [Chloroflexi bacterium]|nr:M42 family metallopeptidase [Chloroflexota bacterium]
LVQLLIDTAQAEGIPYQFKQPLMGSTDSGTIHLAREGVPTTVVSIPSRYIHSPVTLLSLDDLENTVKLMRAALIKLADLEL